MQRQDTRRRIEAGKWGLDLHPRRLSITFRQNGRRVSVLGWKQPVGQQFRPVAVLLPGLLITTRRALRSADVRAYLRHRWLEIVPTSQMQLSKMKSLLDGYLTQEYHAKRAFRVWQKALEVESYERFLAHLRKAGTREVYRRILRRRFAS